MGLFSGKCISTARLDGKTALITGCNTGIGRETVKDFFIRGARVIMACRSEEKAKETADSIKKECKGMNNLGQIQITQLDLTSLKSVRSCAENILENEPNLHLLINNAGIMMCPYSKTEDDFEIQFGTNHLGHFLLTLLLMPKIQQSTPARIVNVSSMAHERGSMDFDDLNWTKRNYSPIKAYGQSKLANVLFTRELAHRIKEANVTGINVYSLHPGVIATELGRHLSETYFIGLVWFWNFVCKPFIKTPVQGAQTTIYCAVDESCSDETGLYYSDCAIKKPSKKALNDDDAKRLWGESLKLVGLKEDFDPFKQ